jgi:PHD finger-like domain-containing protein 5A
MAKHHPDLIMCMKQPGIGERRRAAREADNPPLMRARPRRQRRSRAAGRGLLAQDAAAPAARSREAPPPGTPPVPPSAAAIGRLCEKCDGKCPICDSYVRPATLVRICDECNYGSYEGRCVICGGIGVSDAYYCKECTIQEKDVSVCRGARACLGPALRGAAPQRRSLPAAAAALRPLRPLTPAPCPAALQRDGCPKIINLGSAKTDLFYERKKYGFRKR